MLGDHDDPVRIGSSPGLNHAVYELFLSSDYPAALELAEQALVHDPTDSMALAIRAQCLQAIASSATPTDEPYVSTEELSEEDILSVEAARHPTFVELDDDATEPATLEYVAKLEPTSPTLSLADRGGTGREVYRLFLRSEYPAALALANDLIAAGLADETVTAIARECRLTLTQRSSVPMISAPVETMPPMEPHARDVLAQVDGSMTAEQVAHVTGMPIDDVLLLLERFVALGVLTLRPPPDGALTPASQLSLRRRLPPAAEGSSSSDH